MGIKTTMMNFDDEFTRDFEEKFQKNLAEIRKISDEEMLAIKENIFKVTKFIEDFSKMPEKSPEDIEFVAKIAIDLLVLTQKLEDAKLILGESLNRKARAYYEHVKKLAEEGNEGAKKIYDDLKTHFNRFDAN